jgi:hypothetical protein
MKSVNDLLWSVEEENTPDVMVPVDIFANCGSGSGGGCCCVTNVAMWCPRR